MSVSSRSAQPPEENVSDMRSRSDWERVKGVIAADAPIPYDPNDPDDGPYNPNDEAAVDAFWNKAGAEGCIIRGPGRRGPQKTPTQRARLASPLQGSSQSLPLHRPGLADP